MSNSSDAVTMIEPTTKRVTIRECQNKDNISDLPDCIILHILSFLNAKDAVRTCILSSRWKDLWKSLLSLTLHSSHFRTIKIFNKFVSRVLSLRDSSISLHALDFYKIGLMAPHLLKRIVNYALSHNVQRLGLSVVCDIAQIPPTIFSCHTLTYLKLSVYPTRGNREETLFPNSLNLPALTVLDLQNFAFCAGDNGYAEPFLALNRLKQLAISSCTVRDARILRVSSGTLFKLTLHNHSEDFFTIELRTPSLCTFTFTGTPFQFFSKGSFSSVKHVDIDANLFSRYIEPPVFLLSWLRQLSNIKSLIVSATTLQIIALYPDLSKLKLPSLGMLKSLKVKTKPLEYGFCMKLLDVKLEKVKSQKEATKLRKAFKEGLEPSSPIPDGIMDFFIQNSPLAEVEIIDCSWQKAQSTS
ncbi:F-box protein At4g22280-like [Cicer arietinum]|uniref:F-box/FBD/LRR-repeat protein At5g53840-like n=1 Tax=Cicer arietinum TaxID=3827 RepID=A0A1S2YB15_CICAR|nr:F-box/FBD/LRR-repeat protein At5g53840-like [Cicer arietinum]